MIQLQVVQVAQVAQVAQAVQVVHTYYKRSFDYIKRERERERLTGEKGMSSKYSERTNTNLKDTIIYS